VIPIEWIVQARERIQPHIMETPLTFDPKLNLFLKWENQQVTGSFKARGALNKILALHEWERRCDIVTASAGNHGQGVALAASKIHAKSIVFASEHAVRQKIDAMRLLGAEVRLVPGGYGEAERIGLDFAKKTGATWVSAYNDGQIIAGQGTLAFEILKQEPALAQAEWVVPVGGGGLISGIGSALFDPSLSATLTGIQSQASSYFNALFYTGNQDGVVEQASLGDGLAGPVEVESITIPIVRRCVDSIHLVSEEDIAYAIAFAWHHYRQIIEGSGAVSLAGVLTGKIQTRPAVVVISGGNIQPELHLEIIHRYPKHAIT
jgi:threonine dehydratase